MSSYFQIKCSYCDINVARTEDARDRAQTQLIPDSVDLNHHRAEASLVRSHNRNKVAKIRKLETLPRRRAY